MSEPNSAPRSVVSVLDAILVLAVVVILGGVMAVLSFVHVPQENLPILASLAAGLLGTVVGGYVGFRWGASEVSKRGTPPAAAVAVNDPADQA